MVKDLAWRIQNAPSVAELTVYDALGEWGLTLKDFERELSQVKADKLLVRIHSEGGSATIGLGVFAALKQWMVNGSWWRMSTLTGRLWNC